MLTMWTQGRWVSRRDSDQECVVWAGPSADLLHEYHHWAEMLVYLGKECVVTLAQELLLDVVSLDTTWRAAQASVMEVASSRPAFRA